MRRVIMVVLLAVAAAACGGADDSAATETSANGTLPSTAAPQSTETPAEENGSVAAPTGGDGAVAPDAPPFDGPPAPNFELALADGSSFVLSDEQKPVYLIFWAEW